MTPTYTKRVRAKRGEGDRLRDDIMVVAERLLIDAGNQEAVSVRAIAEAAGCTPPAIYMHFADKDELFMAVCEQRFVELDRYGQEAAARSDDPLESLRLRGKAYVQFGLEHPEHYRLLMMTPKVKSPEELSPLAAGMGTFQHLVEAVQLCIDAGAFASEPGAYQVALTLWAAVHGLTSLLITFPNFEWGERDNLMDFVIDVQIEGLLAT